MSGGPEDCARYYAHKAQEDELIRLVKEYEKKHKTCPILLKLCSKDICPLYLRDIKDCKLGGDYE